MKTSLYPMNLMPASRNTTRPAIHQGQPSIPQGETMLTFGATDKDPSSNPKALNAFLKEWLSALKHQKITSYQAPNRSKGTLDDDGKVYDAQIKYNGGIWNLDVRNHKLSTLTHTGFILMGPVSNEKRPEPQPPEKFWQLGGWIQYLQDIVQQDDSATQPLNTLRFSVITDARTREKLRGRPRTEPSIHVHYNQSDQFDDINQFDVKYKSFTENRALQQKIRLLIQRLETDVLGVKQPQDFTDPGAKTSESFVQTM